jgi:hypothetical protein
MFALFARMGKPVFAVTWSVETTETADRRGSEDAGTERKKKPGGASLRHPVEVVAHGRSVTGAVNASAITGA